MKNIVLFVTLLSLLIAPKTGFSQEKLSTEALLKKLIQFNTSNPPGNEKPIAEFIQNYLKGFGIEAEIIESTPGRANLIARLEGKNHEEALGLLGHLDVAPADPKEWDYAPFIAEEKDGIVYGRGALDIKALIALEINTFIDVKLSQKELARDLVLILTADEKTGGKYGVEFLVKNHWDKIKVKYLFNEGSIAVEKGDYHLYPIQVAEKGVAWMKMKIQGKSGHASVPREDNPVQKLVKTINILTQKPEPIQYTEVVAEFARRIGERLSFPSSFLLKHALSWPLRSFAPSIAGDDILSAPIFNAMIRNTITPTMIQSGYKINVIPAEATAFLDTRILPGTTPELFRQHLLEKINDPKVSLEITLQSTPTISDFKTEYFNKIEKVIHQNDAKALVSPYMSTFGTDSRFFREKGVLAYGISPIVINAEENEGIHGKNEHIRLSILPLGEKIMKDLMEEMLK